MIVFIHGELHQHGKYGFSILLSAADTVRVLGENLKLSRIATVPKEYRRTRLIINMLAQPEERTPTVNETTVREIAPELMQFVRAFLHILQVI